MAIIPVSSHVAASAAGNDQVIPSIAVEITPGDSRPELAELFAQQRLALEIVERVLVVDMLEEMAHVLEERGSVGAWERESVGA